MNSKLKNFFTSLRKPRNLETLLLVVLIAIFAVTLVAFIGDFESLTQQGVLTPVHRLGPVTRFFQHIGVLPHRQILPQQISNWMTFNYINKVFNLPPDYLKTQLSITDSRYPRLSIEDAASGKHEDSNLLAEQIRALVSTYLRQSLRVRMEPAA